MTRGRNCLVVGRFRRHVFARVGKIVGKIMFFARETSKFYPRRYFFARDRQNHVFLTACRQKMLKMTAYFLPAQLGFARAPKSLQRR